MIRRVSHQRESSEIFLGPDMIEGDTYSPNTTARPANKRWSALLLVLAVCVLPSLIVWRKKFAGVGLSPCESLDLKCVENFMPGDSLREASVLSLTSACQLAANIKTSHAFCALVILPKQSLPRNDLERSNLGPDDIYLEYRSTSAFKILPPLKLLPNLQLSKHYIYGANVHLVQPEEYKVEAIRHYGNYDWVLDNEYNFEADGTSIKNFRNESVTRKRPERVIVTGKKRNWRDSLPTCYSDGHKEDASDGTWVHSYIVSQIISPEQVKKHSPTWPLTDPLGWRFVPDHCQLQPMSPLALFQCLAYHEIHVFGDSNIRRWFKAIASGSEYCQGLNEVCQCKEWDDMNVLGIDFNVVESPIVDRPLYLGAGTKVFFAFIGGLLHPSDWTNWREVLPNLPSQWSRKPGALIFSFGAWDLLDVRPFRDWENALQEFRHALESAYTSEFLRHTPILIRLMTPIALENSFDKRPYTPLRIQRSNDAVRKAFGDISEKIYFIDPVMSGRNRKDVNTLMHCNALHTSFFHMQVELQVAFNSICPHLQQAA